MLRRRLAACAAIVVEHGRIISNGVQSLENACNWRSTSGRNFWTRDQTPRLTIDTYTGLMRDHRNHRHFGAVPDNDHRIMHPEDMSEGQYNLVADAVLDYLDEDLEGFIFDLVRDRVLVAPEKDLVLDLFFPCFATNDLLWHSFHFIAGRRELRRGLCPRGIDRRPRVTRNICYQ